MTILIDTEDLTDEEFNELFPMDPLDEELLMERAKLAWNLLRSQEGRGTDPYEVLAAVVWPTREVVEAQLAQRGS